MSQAFVSGLIMFSLCLQVNKIGLKIRAAVITTVYNKALGVSLTTLSKFSSGEVCVILSIFLLFSL